MKKLIFLAGLTAVLCCFYYCSSSRKQVDGYFQPYGDFTNKEILTIQNDLEDKFFCDVPTKVTYHILPSRQLSDSCLNKKKTRYLSLSLLKELKSIRNKDIIIGLTHKDISTPLHGSADYGILGQAFTGGHQCIVSDFRIKNKKDTWKVVSHEFIHAFYNYGHCPADDPTCIIKDAKGKENLAKKYHLCPQCYDNIQKKINWGF